MSVPAASGELLADRAYAELRDRIVTLAIPPGAPINEDALGRDLEMGRTPVREAIKRLALERLVTVFPRRGTFASEINITDLAAISDVRVQLEGHAARRAAERLTPAQRDELDALIAAIDAGESSGDPDTLMRLDASVHRFVYACAAQRVPAGDAGALPEPVAAHLVPRARPAATPVRPGARAPRAAAGDSVGGRRAGGGNRRRARSDVRV